VSRASSLSAARVVALPIAVIVLPILLPILAALRPAWFGPLWAPAIWGLGVIASYVGWGSWLARRLLPRLEMDVGLRAGWGLALTVIAGGPLCLTGLATRPVLLAWMFAGIALAARDLGRVAARPLSLRLLRRWETPIVAILGAVAALTYLGSAGRGEPNPSDDWVAYLPFMHKVLQTGTLLDPFSVRRMASYGGQSYLQAMVRIVADDSQMQLFDGGICVVLLLALVLGCRRGAPPASRLLVLLLGAVVVMLPEIRINSASEVSGAVCFLTAYRTLVLVDRHRPGGLRQAFLVALPLAAVSTLRQNYMAVAGVMTLSLVLRPPAATAQQGSDGVADDRPLRAFVRVAGFIVLCLAPWAALALRSHHTFLFPLFPGNYDPGYAGLTAPASLASRFQLYLATVLQDDPIRAMPLLLLIAPAAAFAAHRRALLGLWLGTILGFAFVAMSLPDADNFSIARYGFAFVVTFALAVGIATAELLATGTKRERVLALAVTGFLALQLNGTRPNLVRNLSVGTDRIAATLTRPGPSPMAATAGDVARMQAAVPAGARMLVMIERPYLLDFARNPIDHWDQVGAASPERGLPLRAGSDAVAAYLVRQGIRYMAFTRPDRSTIDLYSRATWRRLLVGRMRVWRITAPIYLAAFDVVDGLARTKRLLYDDGHLVVVDLAS
jgi:hypothetical protein